MLNLMITLICGCLGDGLVKYIGLTGMILQVLITSDMAHSTSRCGVFALGQLCAEKGAESWAKKSLVGSGCKDLGWMCMGTSCKGRIRVYDISR